MSAMTEIDGDGVAGPRARLEAAAVRGAPIPCLPRRRVGWARRFRGARSPYGALLQGLRSGPGRWLHARARVEGGGRRAPVRARGPPRGGCWRFWRPALMVRGARAWPRGAARRVCAGIAKLVRTLGVSSTCACSSPCLLRVPMRCVLELCILVLGVWCTCAAFAQIVRHSLVIIADISGVPRPVLCAGAVHAVLELCPLVLGVWCTCAAFAQIVRHPLGIIVDISGVHRPVLCAGAVHACVVVLVSPMLPLRVPAVHALAVHACVMRACTSHARVVCTCCACPCCACQSCAFSCGVWCACAALAYIVRRSLTSPTPHSSRTPAP